MAIGGSGDYLTKLRDNLTCPVCFDVFDSRDKLPKALPCIHTLCLSCLGSYVKKNLGESLLCPMCKAKFTLPKGGVSFLPTNTGLLGMLELLPPLEESTTSSQSEGSSKELKIAKPKCKEHDSAECIMFCKKYHVPLCMKCMTIGKKHNHHDLEDIENVLLKMKEDFESAETRYKKVLQDHDRKIENIHSAVVKEKKKVLNEIESVIQARAEQCKEKANVDVDDMLKNITEKIGDNKTAFNKIKCDLKTELDEFKDCDLHFPEGRYNKLEEINMKLDELVKLADDVDETFSKTELDELKVQYDISLAIPQPNVVYPPPVVPNRKKKDIEDNHLKLTDLGMTGPDTVNMYLMINIIEVTKLFETSPNRTLYSQYWYVRGAPWKVETQMQMPKHDCDRFKNKDDPALWVGVICDERRRKKWKYTASWIIELYDYDQGCFVAKHTEVRHVITADHTNWGVMLIQKKDLFQANNPVVKNDCLIALVKVTVH